jgi:hypothetical protein
VKNACDSPPDLGNDSTSSADYTEPQSTCTIGSVDEVAQQVLSASSTEILNGNTQGFQVRYLIKASSLAIAGALAGGGATMLAQQSTASVGPLKPALVEDLVAANRILADYGALDAFGHVSVRHDRSPDRFANSR